ncbi:MAG: S-layer homology domain-containing protein [Clostridiales bacterium]|nr:S-layer homology domain-containing protein [Clostridiales bacterium]
MKIAKKAIALLTVLFLSVGLISLVSQNTRAAGDIAINETNFPDKNFREFLLNHYYGKDGKFSDWEFDYINDLTINNKNISSLKGIEFFKHLETLSCTDNKLTSLDVSKNKELTKLNCSGNQLTKLDLSKNTELTYLNCGSNKLTSLNLKGCICLESLECSSNPLTTLDLSSCKSLSGLTCAGDHLTALDISKNVALINLICTHNQLTSLNVSNCKYLNKAYLQNANSDVDGKYLYTSSSVPDLSYKLICDNNVTIKAGEPAKFENVAVNASNFPDEIFRAYISENVDTDNDGYLSEDEMEIRHINVHSLNISSLKGIELFTSLVSLSCGNNQLTSLDISKNTALEDLSCFNNNLKTLDVSHNTALKELGCYYTQLTKLDVSKNTKLKRLSCDCNQLTGLDVSKNKELKYLICDNNKLTKLDVSNNPALKTIYCHENLLSDLNLKGCSELKNLHCYKNRLTNIDISDCYKLVYSVNNGNKVISNGKVMYSSLPDGAPEFMYELILDPDTTILTGRSSIALKLNKTSLNLICGKTETLKATLKGATGKISWKSSDKNIAAVDSSGKITAKQAGLVVITASAAGKSAKCKVQVLFKDVTSSKDFWYQPTYYLANAGIVKGYDKQTKFKPANDCTRAQMVTFLWRLQGEPKPKASKCKFPDVKTSDYFYKPVIWAVEQGITTGYSDGKFKPQNVCTRAQTVTFLWRMADKPEPKSTKCKFTDVKKKDYFYKSVIWASEMKIVAGYEDNTFKPQGKCLRRQMVTFLYKYDKYVNGKG